MFDDVRLTFGIVSEILFLIEFYACVALYKKVLRALTTWNPY
jgi:hypothetical protein